MTALKAKKSWIALLMAIVVALSLFTVSVFAEDSTTAGTTTETSVATEAGTTAETAGGTSTGTGSSTAAKTEAKTQVATQSASEIAAEKEKKANRNVMIVELIILAVAVIAIAVVCILHKEKVAEKLRGYKSELHKVTWCSKEQTKKNTIVVVVFVLALAVAIALFNTAISTVLGWIIK